MQTGPLDLFAATSRQNTKSTRDCLYIYNTLVRPQLEYASPVWDPDTDKLIYQIEQVQRRAVRWTANNFCRQTSVTRMIEQLGWRTLEQRRTDAHLCLFYKVVHDLVAVPLPDHVQYSNRVSRYCHSMTFRQVSTPASLSRMWQYIEIDRVNPPLRCRKIDLGREMT